MRLGIDIRKYDDLGIGTYIRNLLSVLAVKNGVKCVLFAPSALIDGGRLNGLGETVRDDTPKYSLQELFTIAAKANASRLDLFHAPHYTLPLRLAMPSIVTVHDIIHLRMKQYFSAPKRLYAYGMIRHACRASSAVIVDSHFGKKELLEVFSIPEEKVHVVHLGVDPSFFQRASEEECQRFRELNGLQKPYVLYTGSSKPHKNVPTLLRAFQRLRKEVDAELVCSGEPWRSEPALSSMIDTLGVAPSLHDLGRMDERSLRLAYQCASAVVLPSFYEGFGFSVLEAMASGVPAIGANAASIPEVIGDAGLSFEPLDVARLAELLAAVLTDRSLAASLIDKGTRRAQEFTWERCAERTFAIYQEVLR